MSQTFFSEIRRLGVWSTREEKRLIWSKYASLHFPNYHTWTWYLDQKDTFSKSYSFSTQKQSRTKFEGISNNFVPSRSRRSKREYKILRRGSLFCEIFFFYGNEGLANLNTKSFMNIKNFWINNTKKN